MFQNGTSWEPIWFPVEIAFSHEQDTKLLGVAVASHDKNDSPVSLDYSSLKLSYEVPVEFSGNMATFSPTFAPIAATGNSSVSAGKHIVDLY